MPAPIYADTISTSSVFFLLPSTGIVDPVKSHLTKINDNFQKADTFLGSLQTRVNTLATDTGTIATATGTLTSRINQLSIDTGTLAASTGTIQGFANNLSNSTTTLNNTMAQRTQIWSDEGGTPGANVTGINAVGANITATQSGSTVTLTVTASQTGGPYDLVVGTPGTPNVNCFISDTNGFDLALASVGARGLTWSATAQARILFKDGIYTSMQMSTIPAGISIVGMSSTVWVDGGGDRQRFVNHYGNSDRIRFDFQKKGFQVPKIIVSSGARIGQSEGPDWFYGLNNQASGTGPGSGNTDGSAIYLSTFTYNVKINAVMPDARATAGIIRYGDNNPIIIRYSSQVYLNLDYTASTMALADGTHFGIIGSTEVWFSGIYRNMGSNGFVFQDGCERSGIKNAKIFVDPGAGAGLEGLIVVGTNQGPSDMVGQISTHTLLSNIEIVTEANITYNLIAVNGSNAGRRTSGLIIRDVIMDCRGTNSITAIKLNGSLPDRGAINTVIDNVDVDGCSTALSDTGFGTKKVGLRLNSTTQ